MISLTNICERRIYLAITFIKPMKTAEHIANAIRYATEDKVDIENENIIHKTLSTYINTSPYSTAKEWEMVRQSFGKDNGRLGYQIIQNFGEDIDPVLANKIGVEFAKELLGNRQCIVSTHTNTPYVHNHILFNSPDLEKGEKYYNNNETYYGKVRKISDKLCEKYGLKVLENTREGTFVFYKDNRGNTRYFEPTERKRRNFNNAYAQMEVWKQEHIYKKIKRDEIKNDMDIIIKISNSYEDFVQKMRNIGYEVKDKTSKGEWRKHITFVPPNSKKGVRDTAKELIGYTRLDITRMIEQRLAKKERGYTQGNMPSIITPNNFKDYSEDFKKRKYISDVSKIIADNVKSLNREVDLKYSEAFKNGKRQNEIENFTKSNQILFDKINSQLKTLNYVENNNIATFENLKSRMRSALEKRNAIIYELNGIKDKLKTANQMIAVIEKANLIGSYINKQKEMYGIAYTDLETNQDVKLYNVLKKELASSNLATAKEQNYFVEKIENFKCEYENLVITTQEAFENLYRIDDIYRTIKDIDKNDNNYSQYLREYEMERWGSAAGSEDKIRALENDVHRR